MAELRGRHGVQGCGEGASRNGAVKMRWRCLQGRRGGSLEDVVAVCGMWAGVWSECMPVFSACRLLQPVSCFCPRL